MTATELPLAIVTGVGPGTGSAMVRRFAAEGYQVAMLARNLERLRSLESEIPNTKGYACDLTNPKALDVALEEIVQAFGTPKVVIHNAVNDVSKAMGTFIEIDPEDFRNNFEINVMSLLHLARDVAPRMVAAGGGSLIVTGNTSSLRGRARFAAFAPTKAAARILTETMARDLGPRGVHVAYLIIDAVIDVPWARERFSEAADDFFIKPAAIADEVWHLANQDPSAWSFLAEVRPYREAW